MKDPGAPFTIGKWRVEPAGHSLERDGTVVRLSPKAMQVLSLLADHRGEVVSREQILRAVWPGRMVVEESVTQVISELRKKLGDTRQAPEYIETISKAGYRLIIGVHFSEPLLRSVDSSINSIAVLPFSDLSKNRDQAYFCDGMADELIGALSRVPGLKVISRTSSFQYRDSAADLRDVAAHLGVSFMVEGSVQRQEDALRINVRLIEMPQGYQSWTARFDRDFKDVFAIQDEIARQVVHLLEVESPVLAAPERPDILAYDFYLRGRHYFYRGGAGAGRIGREMFKRAIEVDGSYALAHAGLADSRTFAWLYYDYNPANLDAARQSAERAVELAPSLAEAHASRGCVLSAANDFRGATAEFNKAIELSPTSFEPHYLYGRSCLAEGDFEGAALCFARAEKIRPESFQVYSLLARAFRALGQDEEEREAQARAYKIVEHHLLLSPGDVRALCVAAGALAALGETEKAVSHALLACQTSDPLNYYAACALARAGRDQQAMETLEQAVESGWNHLAWLDNDPELDGFRHAARFIKIRQLLIARLG